MILTSLVQVAEYEGAWGKVFQEIAPGSNPISSPSPAAMAAQGVSELLRQHRLPSFDLVKIDIEGAEGAVFDRGTADLSWIRLTKVICLEVHDYFGSHFGLGPQVICTSDIAPCRVQCASALNREKKQRCNHEKMAVH